MPYGSPGAAVNAAGVLPEVGGAGADFPWDETARAERGLRGNRLVPTVRPWNDGVYCRELDARRGARPTGRPARLDAVLARRPSR